MEDVGDDLKSNKSGSDRIQGPVYIAHVCREPEYIVIVLFIWLTIALTEAE